MDQLFTMPTLSFAPHQASPIWAELHAILDVVTIAKQLDLMVMIETVGVGQSETIAAQTSDLFVLRNPQAGMNCRG